MSDPQEHRFPCTTCGADMRYEPGTSDMVCDHCGANEAILSPATVRLNELDFRKGLALALDDADTEETRVLQCENCGAQVEFDTDTHAAECPFCATPVVTDTGLHRHIKPRGLLPFALQEGEARARMNDWLGSLWFAPSGLQDYARAGRALQGIYVPYWTYDAQTSTKYTGKRGNVHYVKRTETVTVNGKRQTRTRRERKISWSNRSGTVSRFFDDVLVLASRSLPKDYTDALAPWDLSALETYRAEYLAGFRAEGYTVDLQDGYDEARAFMDRMIHRDIKADIGGDEQQVTSRDTRVWDITFKHILLPVWVAAYKYRGKTYRFVVNGQTGTVKGQRPYSRIKIAIAVILGAIAAAAIGYIVSQNQ